MMDDSITRLHQLAPMLAEMVGRGEGRKAKRILHRVGQEATSAEMRVWVWRVGQLVDAAISRARNRGDQAKTP